MVGLIFVVALTAASAQCANKTGFALQLCELQSGLSSAGGPARGVAPVVASVASPARMLTTSLSDAIHTDILDPSVSPKEFKPLLKLDRADDGSFILKSGFYEAYVESYCFENPDNMTARIGAFFPAPIKGPRATVIAAVLKQSELHPEIGQPAIQQLLSAIFAGTDLEKMPMPVQQTAVTILPRAVAKQLQGSAVAKDADSTVMNVINQHLKALSASQKQDLLMAKNTADSLQRVGADVQADRADLPAARGTWAQMPGGFYVRYLPDSYNRTRLQIMVPDAGLMQADPAHPLTFDPTQFLAILSQAPGQRLGITLRQIDPLKH
jgi:hypothetical protein